MLKIKDGKLYGSNYSFALPEGFYINCGKRLELANDDGLVIIIDFKNGSNSAKKDTQEIIDANDSLIKMSDFISVKRGEGVGVGIYYRDESLRFQHYEELYDFKENRNGETQIDIFISLFMRRPKETIQKILELPTVKAFLESIEYF